MVATLAVAEAAATEVEVVAMEAAVAATEVVAATAAATKVRIARFLVSILCESVFVLLHWFATELDCQFS